MYFPFCYQMSLVVYSYILNLAQGITPLYLPYWYGPPQRVCFFAPFWSEFGDGNFCQVWKRVWILEVWSEKGSGKWHVLVWNRVRIWRSGLHTPTRNSQEYPLPGNLGGNWALIYVRFYNVVYQNDYYLETWWESGKKILQTLYARVLLSSDCRA